MTPARALPALLALGMAGCSPTFDWREAQAEEAPLAALFPCKPDRFTRTVQLAGAPVAMRMSSCEAGGTTFALSHVNVNDPARVAVVLQALRGAVGSNLGMPAKPLPAVAVPGMTPQPLAGHVGVEGRRGDGSPVRVQAVFFAGGLQVYQATTVGSAPNAEAVDTFFSSLRLTP